MIPKDYVAIGQLFELIGEPGSLFTVTETKRTWNYVDGELWFVTLLCIVPPRYAWPQGATGTEATRTGTLSTPWRRIA